MTEKPSNADGMNGRPEHFLHAAIAAASLQSPLVELKHGRARLIVPEGFKALEVDSPFALPPRIRQGITVDERASLVAYVNRFSDQRSILIADYDAGRIAARLDYHGAKEDGLDPNPGEHNATLVLRPSEEFRRWNAIQGKRLEQADFAAFLEENAEDIVDPAPAVMIEISRDLEATQGVVFKSSTRLENGDRGFVYETETRTKGEVVVPRQFTLEIPLWQGEEPTQLRCAFRWQVSGGGLLLGFEWRRVEYQRRAYFTEIAYQIAEDTGRPVYFGRLD